MTPFRTFPHIKTKHVLAPYTTFRVGGPADYFYDLTNLEELPGLLAEADKNAIPVFILGAGSNTLFHDHGFRGLVVRISASHSTVDGECIMADAGTPMHMVVDTAQKAGLSGLESFTGLPGTVGGAIRGNAGCFGIETKDVLNTVTLFDALHPQKGFFTKTRQEMAFGYRTSFVKTHPDYIVCRATFVLHADDPQKIKEKMADIRASRKTKQPPGPSAGSWFKNPKEGSAGQLLDEAGCKGLTVGGAKISPYHANFFLNTGGATSADLLSLSEKAKELVQAKFGVLLETEIKIVAERI